MEASLEAGLKAEYPAGVIVFSRDAELRFRGQMHTVRVDLDGLSDVASIRQRFDAVYRKRYGHTNAGTVELVALRCSAKAGTLKPDWRAGSEGGEVVGSTPPEFASFIKRELAKWTKVIKESGAKIE